MTAAAMAWGLGGRQRTFVRPVDDRSALGAACQHRMAGEAIRGAAAWLITVLSSERGESARRDQVKISGRQSPVGSRGPSAEDV